MTVEQLQKAREALPFRPFSIHMADGRSFRVPHRDFMWLTPGGRTLMVAGNDGAASILDSLLVTELAFEAEARVGGGEAR